MLAKPVITGGELAVLANIAPDALPYAMQPLLSNGIISTNDHAATEMMRRYFNLNPSARDFARYAAR